MLSGALNIYFISSHFMVSGFVLRSPALAFVEVYRARTLVRHFFLLVDFRVCVCVCVSLLHAVALSTAGQKHAIF